MPDNSTTPTWSSAISPPVELGDDEFEAIRKLTYERVGINLTAEKRTLVTGRLQKILRERKLPTFRAYYDLLVGDGYGPLFVEFVNRITTNHTYFYRESDHFERLSTTVLPEITARLEAAGERDLRVWCAGCSSGEEAHTLVMLQREFLGEQASRWQAGLLATDISQRVLDVARAAIYPLESLRRLPETLHRYFTAIDQQVGRVRPDIVAEITFRRLNLLTRELPFKRPFHIIFCRNVMIYFDQETREALLRRFAMALEPGGYLFIGHSESIRREGLGFTYVQPAVYRREGPIG